MLWKVAAIYEDKSNFWQRYTVVLKSTCPVSGRTLHRAFSLNADGKDVHYFYTFFNPDDEEDNRHLGKEVDFSKLPEQIQEAILSELS